MADMHPEGGQGGAAWTLPEELRLLAEVGDSEAVAEVISVFQSDTQARIRTLHPALAAGDAARLRAQAHAIKGSAAQVGARQVAEISREIEVAAVAGDLGRVAGLLPALESEFSAVRRAMSESPLPGR